MFALDSTNGALVADPSRLYAQLREAGDVVALEGENLFAVASHAAVLEVLSRPQEFSSRAANQPVAGQVASPEADAIRAHGLPAVPVLLTADPPDHTRHRRLVQAAFSRRRVDQLANAIEEITQRLLGTCPATGHLELRRSLAEPLPLHMIAGALGLPTDDIGKIHSWSDAVVARIGRVLTADQQVEVARQNFELQDYLGAAIERRRTQPEDDLLTDIVQAEQDENDSLSPAQVMGILEQVLVAGNETATRTIVFTLHRMAIDPDLQARLRARPEDIPNVIEEVLRLESPVQSKIRVATRASHVGRAEVPAGARLVVLLAAANRDPAVFPMPDVLDPDRPNVSDHLAFSRGAHFCVGAALARAEIAIAVRALLERYRDIRLSPDHPAPVYEPSLVHRGLVQLDLVVA
jgi:cytochrome P450